MGKYWVIMRNTWEEMTTYRLSFTMWRIRTVMQLLTMYFLWIAVLPQKNILYGYNQSLLLTYVLGTAIVGTVVLSSRSYEVGDEINKGDLSNYLLRPINYFLYWFARDAGDKAMNVAFAVVELTILFFILRPPFFIQTHPLYLLFFLLSIMVAIVMYFFFNFLMGLIGFWSPEVWAPRYIFITLLYFFAGGLFPLDMLPKQIFSIIQFLPFTYMLYFPVKIYLGQLSITQMSTGLVIGVLWTGIVFLVVRGIWFKGLRLYTAQGR